MTDKSRAAFAHFEQHTRARHLSISSPAQRLELIEDAWQAGRKQAIEACIAVVEQYKVNVGNSAAGEIACQMTMDNLRDIRDELKELK